MANNYNNNRNGYNQNGYYNNNGQYNNNNQYNNQYNNNGQYNNNRYNNNPYGNPQPARPAGNNQYNRYMQGNNQNPYQNQYRPTDDIGEQIRQSVAASTEWINNVISSVKSNVPQKAIYARPVSGISAEEMRRRSEEQRKRREAMAAQARARQAQRAIIDDVPTWKSVMCGLGVAFFGLFAVIGITGAISDAVKLDISGMFIGLAFLLINAPLAIWSFRRSKQVGRYSAYAKYLMGKQYVSIDELTNNLGFEKKTVLKDLRRMIREGILRQAHIDDKEEYILMTNEIYQQYRNAQLGYQQRMASENVSDEEYLRRKDVAKNKELAETLEKGNEYIKQIRAANDKIPGKEITEKLDRLEVVAKQVFKIVEEHPEKLPEIYKFMEYYMPTTLKLVNNYYEFDRQPVQGENITNGKAEIEKTIDMINVAFENLANKLYQDVAMEVSAEISAMQTILSQEGLGSDELENLKQNAQSDASDPGNPNTLVF